VVREKSGKMNYYNYSVAAIIVQTIIGDYNNSTIDQSARFLTLLFQPKYPTYTIIACLGLHNTMNQLHLFISLLLRGSIISKCSLKMSGKVREFDRDWRVATTIIVESGFVLEIFAIRLRSWALILMYLGRQIC